MRLLYFNYCKSFHAEHALCIRICIETTNRCCSSLVFLVFCKWLFHWISLPSPVLGYSKNEHRYLKAAARELMCMTATSAPSERVFSHIGELYSAKGTNLGEESLLFSCLWESIHIWSWIALGLKLLWFVKMSLVFEIPVILIQFVTAELALILILI